MSLVMRVCKKEKESVPVTLRTDRENNLAAPSMANSEFMTARPKPREGPADGRDDQLVLEGTGDRGTCASFIAAVFTSRHERKRRCHAKLY